MLHTICIPGLNCSGIPGLPSTPDIVNSVLSMFVDMFTTGTKNSMQTAIHNLSLAQSADLSASWFRAIESVVLAVSILISVFVLVYQLFMAAFRNDLEPLARAAKGTITLLLLGPFITVFVMMLIYISDTLSKIAVAIGSYHQSSTHKWDSALSVMDFGGQISNSLIGFVAGWLLNIEVSPFQYLTFIYVVMLTLTLATGIFSHDFNIVQMFMLSGLIAAIFTKPAMLFVMALSGNILGHFQPVAFGMILTVYILVSQVPWVLFWGTFITMIVRRSRKRKQRKLQAEVRPNDRQPQLRHHVAHAALTHGGEKAAVAGGIAAGAIATYVAGPVAGKYVNAGTKVALSATSNYLRQRAMQPK